MKMLPVMLGIIGVVSLLTTVVCVFVNTVFVFPVGIKAKVYWVAFGCYVLGLVIGVNLIVMTWN